MHLVVSDASQEAALGEATTSRPSDGTLDSARLNL
jgi:hypothetical protein